jgi:hypothetical protein
VTRLRYNNAGGTLGASLASFSPAIAVDASTPAFTQGNSVSSVTTNSFTPPASSLLVIVVAITTGTTGVTAMTDSLTTHLTYRRLIQNAYLSPDAEVWVADIPATAPGSMTVTATVPAGTNAMVAPLVLTGALPAASQTGATAGNHSNNATPTVSLTTTAAGSFVVGGVANWSNSVFPTVPAGQTVVFNGITMETVQPNTASAWVQAASSPVASGTIVTINDTAPTNIEYAMAIAEILMAPWSAQTITFSSAPSFGTLVSPDYVPLVLDPPQGATPNPKFEIVYLNGYTAGQTTGTVTRPQEGTTAGSHANGAAWVCAPSAYDFAAAAASVARAYLNAAQSLTAGTWTKIALDSISFDPGGCFSTANHRYNVPTAGFYRVNANVFFASAATNQQIAVYKNGTVVSQGVGYINTGGAVYGDIISCSAGDYLELWAYTISGMALNTGSNQIYMAIQPVGT